MFVAIVSFVSFVSFVAIVAIEIIVRKAVGVRVALGTNYSYFQSIVCKSR
jgi:hypothetical protein